MARTDVTGVYATCPMINNVIDLISYYAHFDHEDEIHKETILKTLEDIRSANSELRDFGTITYSEKESEISDLERKISRLEDKISGLEAALQDATLEGENLINALNQYL